ncbi:MAG: PqqD family protein [Coxiellaceae bacterium]|nr:PqqD family protein [Coxiellaceae bacterium]
MKNNDVLLKQNNELFFYTMIEDKIFILDSENGQYYWFNETASQLWCWLEKPISAAQLTQKLLKNANSQAVISNHSIESWINDALAKNLICIYQDNDCNITEGLLSATVKDGDIKHINFTPPKTYSLEANSIHGASNEFQTDNFETGS